MNRRSTLLRGAALTVAALLATAGALSAQVDFSRYVAIGDSLTAGFQSGGLTQGAQQFSYPALIYAQATGSSAGFEQPLVSAPGIPPVNQLVSLQGPVIRPASGLGNPLNLNLPAPYNNLGVPGADVADVVGTVTDGGGLHDLILRGIGTQLQQAIAQQPTFITVWIGNNDVLGAATSGIVLDGITLTRAADFEADYRFMAGALATTGAPMVFGNVGSVTTIPFVTTLPPVLVDPATRQPVIIGGNFVPLIGPDGPLALNDFVLLTASAELAQGRGIPVAAGGTGLPLSDTSVLNAAEAAAIDARRREINAIIATVANEVGAAVFDNDAFFGNIAAHGLELGGIGFSVDFLTGGLFSYDGVHPTGLGYALAANQFIRVINRNFGAEIPLVNLAPYVFGGRGTVTGLPVGSTMSQLRFTRAAQKQLYASLGLPKRQRLLRIKANRADTQPPEEAPANDRPPAANPAASPPAEEPTEDPGTRVANRFEEEEDW